MRDFLLAPPAAEAERRGSPSFATLHGAEAAWPPLGATSARSVRASERGRRGVPVGLADLFVHRPEAAVADARTDVTDGTAVIPAELSVGALAVLCAAEDARAVGVAAAGVLARRVRSACALACVWTAPEPHRHPEARPPAGRAARRLALALAARDLDAVPCGRAAVVALPADPAEAVAAAGRAGAAAGAAPTVLVLGGPRAAGFDDLLAVQDRVLVVTRPDAADTIAALAVAGLPPAGPPHERCTLALGPVGRALAASALATPAAVRRALEPRGEARP